jgi:hypothetical protein
MSKASRKPRGGSGWRRKGQELAHLAQVRRRGPLAALQRHPHGHPLHRAEQIDQRGHGRPLAVGPRHVLEQHGRATLREEARLDLRHLQHGGDRLAHADQLARAL